MIANRPTAIVYRVIDPFDDRLVVQVRADYNPHRAATGHYSRFGRTLRNTAQHIERMGLRQLKLSVTLERPSKTKIARRRGRKRGTA